jgi:hypothetical protein
MSGLDHDQVHQWRPGTPLPELHPMDHLPDRKTRLAQRIVHPMLLPLLDPKRRKFNKAYQPTFISPDPQTTGES